MGFFLMYNIILIKKNKLFLNYISQKIVSLKEKKICDNTNTIKSNK